jgi:hypothetical protein
MASQHSSAGVYTKSNDLSGYGARTKTTVVGTVGQARQGPVNKPIGENTGGKTTQESKNTQRKGNKQ